MLKRNRRVLRVVNRKSGVSHGGTRKEAVRKFFLKRSPGKRPKLRRRDWKQWPDFGWEPVDCCASSAEKTKTGGIQAVNSERHETNQETEM